MNINILGEQIARYRKALGMTQEDLGRAVGISAQAVSRWECGGAPDVTLLPAVADALGVTTDALFGREGGERVDIRDVARRWIVTLPQDQRIDQLCRLVWAAMGPAMSGKLEDVADTLAYMARCESEDETSDQPVRWLRRTRITTEGGVALGVRAEDMSFAILFPEPEEGWEPFLPDNGLCRRLFEVLARPRCLELLEYLYSKPPMARRYTPGAIARPMGLEAPEAEALMDALSGLNLLSKTELETEDGIIPAYLLSDEEALVPFLYLARWMTTGGGGFLNGPYRKSPMLRGEKWKETEEN